MKKLLAAALLSAAAAPAFAAPTADSGYYVGVDVGNGKMKVKNCTGGCPSPTKDNETVGGILLGYQYNKNLAVEVKYTGTGKWESSPGGATGDIKGDALALVVVGIAPINNEFSVYGKLGVASNNLKASNATWGLQDTRKTDVTFGIGGQYNVSQTVGIRLGYDSYKGKIDGTPGNTGVDGDSDVWTVGVVFKF